MSEEKQIEEMAYEIETRTGYLKSTCHISAEILYNAGYRKQKDGEWNTIVDNKDDIVTECSACKNHFWFMKKGQLNIDRMPFCPNCGAKMIVTNTNVGDK